ncbi:uncharacterized protein [Arachis hypogaea]|uniref:uncharacterized protein isoform X2 n=1 Tax=Arachis hypogaea TaxID=3818 RepID=UPI0007870B59|nr:uncharacterized protein LOC112708033 isoform X2 [Arachis hypogaea]QHO32584.1 uncharacterized protein DS421_8g251080 [Arachis hypogaea]
MEPSMMQYQFVVVSKGRNTGIFTSFDEASRQVVDFSDAEYSAFNCQATAVGAYLARVQSMEVEGEELREMGAESQDPVHSPPAVNAIPPTKAASGNYAINVNMEEWLLKVSYRSSIPPKAFFRRKIGILNVSIHYAFTVVIPGSLRPTYLR